MPVTAQLLFVLSTLVTGGQVHATLPAAAALSVEVIEAQMELDLAVADSQQFEAQPIADKKARCRTLAGVASWYGPGFHGRTTASGERYNMNALTAAHRTLPFGTHVRVTNRESGKSVIVRINDRGPYHGNRVIDLSKAAARSIGMDGLCHVQMETCI